MYPYIIRDGLITIVIGNKSHELHRDTHPNYDRVLEAIRNEEWDQVEDLVDISKAVEEYVSDNGDIEVVDGNVYFEGRPFHNALSDRLLEMLKQGFPVEPLCNFLSNLKQNPSKRAVDELYGFLEKNNLPITPDGHFLAYKKVRSDFTDIHSGTFDNSPGQVCEMPRNEVDEDKDRTCSSGLHFCSIDYLPHFGGWRSTKVVILKINPRDVVSIPSDYNNAKGRTSRYEVLAEHGVEDGRPTEAFDTVVKDDNDYRGDSDLPEGMSRDADGRVRTTEELHGRARPHGFSFNPAIRNEDSAVGAAGSGSVTGHDSTFRRGSVREPRAVRKDMFGYRYIDNGAFASRAAYEEWCRYVGKRP